MALALSKPVAATTKTITASIIDKIIVDGDMVGILSSHTFSQMSYK
jgi:hypothetical protein